MRSAVAIAIALIALAGARFARHAAARHQPAAATSTPYAPSPDAAPFLSLGYREAAADLLLVRMIGYFGSEENDANVLASLAETITTLDPAYSRAYDFGSIAMTAAKRGVDNSIHFRAIELLERAAKQFPTQYRYPNLAGQIYLVDLQTSDPAQRREWDERGALLLESAARKPGAPADAALQAAILQTRFGKQQRAIEQLRELLLVTSDEGAREAIIEKIAELAGQDADEIALELLVARRRFLHEWRSSRPALSASMYVLIGPRPAPGFDLATLATGGDLIGTGMTFEHLEPIPD